MLENTIYKYLELIRRFTDSFHNIYSPFFFLRTSNYFRNSHLNHNILKVRRENIIKTKTHIFLILNIIITLRFLLFQKQILRNVYWFINIKLTICSRKNMRGICNNLDCNWFCNYWTSEEWNRNWIHTWLSFIELNKAWVHLFRTTASPLLIIWLRR